MQEARIRKVPMMVTLAVIVALSMWNMKAFGAEADKETIVFLTGTTCDERERLQNQLPDYYVYCTNEPNVAWARLHFWAFEQWFYVIYVQSGYYELTDTLSVAGIAFNGKESGYAISIDASFVVEHERLHLVCKCYKTSDGAHG